MAGNMGKLMPLVVMAILPVGWYVVLHLLSAMSGWARLAERFQHVSNAGDRPIKTFRMRSGSVGYISYSSCLTIGVSARGLYLGVSFPFRIGHPTLFLPWPEFHRITVKRRFMFSLVKADIGEPPITELTLPAWLLDYMPACTQSRTGAAS